VIYKSYKELIEHVKGASRVKTVALAMSEDAHALEAVMEARKERIAEPIMVGDVAKTKAILEEHGFDYEGIRFVEALTPEDAAKTAIELVKSGEADFLMKGKLQTADLLRQVVKKDNDFRVSPVLSHLSIFEIPAYHKLLFLTDAGMVMYPDVDTKQALLENMLEFTDRLGYVDPKVAVLCSVETFNPKMPESVDAKELKERWQAGKIKGSCILEGPISFDLAVNSEVAEIKGYESPVAGDADILLCPDICTGNISAKAFIQFGHAIMTGIVWGARSPIVVTSRGASMEEKYLSLVIASIVA